MSTPFIPQGLRRISDYDLIDHRTEFTGRKGNKHPGQGKWSDELLNSSSSTCLNCRMAPLMRRDSLAIMAIPSLGSRSCRSEALAPDMCCCKLHHWPLYVASGWLLWRMMRELGAAVRRTGGGGLVDRTLSRETERASSVDDLRRSHPLSARHPAHLKYTALHYLSSRI